MHRGMAGTKIELKFTVNALGKAKEIKLGKPLTSYRHEKIRDFACGMKNMLAGWEFEPAKDANNLPVAVKVILPVQIIKKGEPA